MFVELLMPMIDKDNDLVIAAMSPVFDQESHGEEGLWFG